MRPAFDARNRLGHLVVLPCKVFDEGNEEGPHFSTLRVMGDVINPIVMMRFDGVGKRLEAGQARIGGQIPAKGIDTCRDAVDRVADVVEDGIDHLQPPLGKCLHQRFFRPHLIGDVTENADGPANAAPGVQ